MYANSQQIARVNEIKINSAILDQKRQVLIYTPQLYDENTLVNYDVIYVMDSQNRELFDLVHSLVSFIDINKRYIVVGITSPYYEETNYARNNDYLPEPINVDRKDFYDGYCCNSTNFKKYIMSEVMSYIDNNYRTTKHKICIGHSLSASFAIDFMLTNDLFDAYLAISPNLSYDKEQLATKFMNFDFIQIKNKRFLYITDANEDWEGWKQAREKVYTFLNEKENISNNIHINIESFPESDHWSTYLPALTNGLRKYFDYLDSQEQTLSEETYKVKIRVKVPDSNNKVFITGNQKSLGDWNPSLVEMKKVSDYEREIELNLQSPVEIQITRGNWDTKAIIKGTYETENIKLDPSTKKLFDLEIIEWLD